MGAGHSGDGAAGADHRDGRKGRDIGLDQHGRHPTEAEKEHVAASAQTILNMPAEDVQKKQVADQMGPTTVQENAAQEGQQTRQPALHKGLRELGRHPAIVGKKRSQVTTCVLLV